MIPSLFHGPTDVMLTYKTAAAAGIRGLDPILSPPSLCCSSSPLSFPFLYFCNLLNFTQNISSFLQYRHHHRITLILTSSSFFSCLFLISCKTTEAYQSDLPFFSLHIFPTNKFGLVTPIISLMQNLYLTG